MADKGVPLVLNGKTAGTPGPATTTPLVVHLTQPGMSVIGNPANPPRPATARSSSFRHISGTGDLRIYPNRSSDYLTLHPNESVTFDGLMSRFTVIASAGTVEWEAVCEVR